MDCQSGLTLDADHPASGLCLWIAHDSVVPVSSGAVSPENALLAVDSLQKFLRPLVLAHRL